jgi:hypothetical protein
VPFQISVFSHFPSVFHQLLVVLGIFFPILSSELFRENVADKNPDAYLKTLKLKSWVYNIFWVLLFAFILTLSLLASSVYLPNTITLILSLGLFALIVELIVGVSILEAAFSSFDLPLIFSKKDKLAYFRANAKACFLVIATENDLEKNIPNFKLGIDNVNDYFKTKFKLGILKFQDYCNFFRLIAFSRNNEEKDRIRKSLSTFAISLKCEMDLTDCLIAIRDIIGKPIFSFEEVVKEVEFDVGFRKSISKNKEFITFLIALVVAVLTAIQVIPIVWSALHPVQNPSVAKMIMGLLMTV